MISRPYVLEYYCRVYFRKYHVSRGRIEQGMAVCHLGRSGFEISRGGGGGGKTFSRGANAHPKRNPVIVRGATALLVAVATPAATRRSTSQVVQLVPINAHATWQPRSVERAMATKGEDTKL